MQREAVLRTLNAKKQELATKYGVTRLGIFGSVARDQITEASDVAIIVEMPPDLFQMVHMKEELEQSNASNVDLKILTALMTLYLTMRALTDSMELTRPRRNHVPLRS